jgi:hypothetical protein
MTVPDRDRWWEVWQDTPRRTAPTRWTDWQRRVLESPYHLSVNWGPNGIGKSLVLAEKARRAICGTLPWQRPGRQVVILAGKTWTQLGSTLRYLWEGVEPGWFRPGVRYESGGVKGQRLAVYDIVGGPGAGNELRCGTFNAENLAGPRATWIGTDEPFPEPIHNELWPRLFGRNGRMDAFFTTTIATTGKIQYLWDIVDDPERPWAGEVHTALDLAAVTPRGGLVDIPWVTQGEIDMFESGLSAIERDMRMGRSRKPRLDTAYFSAWGPHLRQDYRPRPGDRIGIGIDHGSRPGAQRASLIYVSGSHHHARVHVGAHYKADGRTEIEQDARGILDMVQRAGHRVEDVDVWLGDRSHGGDKWGGVKSNVRLQRAIAQVLGINVERQRHNWIGDLPGPLQAMRKPRKYDGSVWDGCEELHRLMVAGRFTLSPATECDALDTDFSEWQAAFTDPAKDGIDSVRYPAVAMVDERAAA